MKDLYNKKYDRLMESLMGSMKFLHIFFQMRNRFTPKMQDQVAEVMEAILNNGQK